MNDPTTTITESLVDMLRRRAAVGLAKYGTTLDRTDLTLEDWLQHQLEELLDGAGYAQAALRQLRAAPARWREEWQGSGLQRGWHMRVLDGGNYGSVIAFLGDQISSDAVQALVIHHNAAIAAAPHPEGEDDALTAGERRQVIMRLREAAPSIYDAYMTWPEDIRKKLSIHDLRRMGGWTPPEPAPSAPANCAEPPVADLRGAIEGLLDAFEGEVPAANCSCHLSPPCGDCFTWAHKREAIAYARAQLAQGDAPFTATPPAAKEPRTPDGYAYRYISPLSGNTVIRFNGGQEVNGQKPIEAVPYFLDTPDGDWVRAGDVQLLVDQIDEALNGETGRAGRPSLCDIAGQVDAIARRGGPILPRVHDAQQDAPASLPISRPGAVWVKRSDLPVVPMSPPLVGERGPDPILKCLRCGAIGSIVCGGADCPRRSNPA